MVIVPPNYVQGVYTLEAYSAYQAAYIPVSMDKNPWTTHSNKYVVLVSNYFDVVVFL